MVIKTNPWHFDEESNAPSYVKTAWMKWKKYEDWEFFWLQGDLEKSEKIQHPPYRSGLLFHPVPAVQYSLPEFEEEDGAATEPAEESRRKSRR